MQCGPDKKILSKFYNRISKKWKKSKVIRYESVLAKCKYLNKYRDTLVWIKELCIVSKICFFFFIFYLRPSWISVITSDCKRIGWGFNPNRANKLFLTFLMLHTLRWTIFIFFALERRQSVVFISVIQRAMFRKLGGKCKIECLNTRVSLPTLLCGWKGENAIFLMVSPWYSYISVLYLKSLKNYV